MTIIFYDNISDNKSINKSITEISQDTCFLLEQTNVFNPLLMLKNNFPLNANYCYIVEFQRYYYIDKQELEINNAVYVRLYCDVLMTFRTEILASMAHCVQSENFNKYTEGLYTIDTQTQFNKLEFQNPFSDTKTNVLITVRG